MIKPFDKNSCEYSLLRQLFKNTQEIKYHKNEVVVEMGAVCNYLFLIEQGLLRNHYIDDKGNDITHWFASEGMILTIAPSFFKRKPSFLGTQALEETVVKALSFDKYEEELGKSLELEKFSRMLAVEVMITFGNKIVDLQTKSAEYRYDQLIKSHPDIFKRVKLGHIAGYLGIQQQTLSKIRASKYSGD